MKTYTQNAINAALLIACLSAQSQTLTCQYNCPQPGEVFSVKTSSPVAATQGLNQLWNFAQIQAVSTGVMMVSYVSPSATPSANSYTQATVAKSQVGLYTYYETGNGGIKLTTAANTTVNSQSQVLPLPFYYGSSHSETITTVYYNGSNKIEVRKSKKLNGVGTGTLILPTGTYTDVLLISGQSVESRTIAGVPEGNVVTNNFSYFYSEKISHPVLYSEYKWETGPTDYAPYTEFIAGVHTEITGYWNESAAAITLVPNPCADVVHVAVPVNDPYAISVINALGKTVQSLNCSGGNTELDLSDLPVGLYTVLVSQKGSAQYKKLIVSR